MNDQDGKVLAQGGNRNTGTDVKIDYLCNQVYNVPAQSQEKQF